MPTRYKIYNKDKAYFITITIVKWLKVFETIEQKLLIVNSLKYCQESKGLEIYGWCLMPNHLHIICKAVREIGLSDILRDLKKFTSKAIVKQIIEEDETNRKWMLNEFRNACKHLIREQEFKVWQNGYHAKEIFSNTIFYQKLEYIHLNPVEAGFVTNPEDYLFSSARNYAELSSYLDIVMESNKLVTV